MKNFSLIKIVSLVLSIFICNCECFSLNIGDAFVIKNKKFVPLFVLGGANFEHEVGVNGANCYSLDTVLPPGSFVKIIDGEEDETVHISCKVSEVYFCDGFVHRKFFEWSMESMESALFDATVPISNVLSIKEICDLLNFYVEKRVPYSWGCNNFSEIDLCYLYTFTCKDNERENVPYVCKGFDCSGLLHAVSAWLLPHDTRLLYNFQRGKRICELGRDSLDEEFEDALKKMKDTDFVVFSRRYVSNSGGGHVIISLHGGFVETYSCDHGIIFTDKNSALKRLKSMARTGRIRVIRWHPELLKEDDRQ